MSTAHPRRRWRALPWLGALLLFWLAAAATAQEGDPPGRVALLSYRQGSVVFAPQGEDEWTELRANRPLTRGDRLWSDRGARAELQLGSATVHLDGASHLGLVDLDARTAQFILQEGTANARVRELLQGENFEIGTPNLAFRALQPGDYRIDVDPRTQQTRVVVHSGLAAVFGDGGQSVQLGAGQQASFTGRQLAAAQGPVWRQDGFDLWAADRNRLEDRSASARHVPRGVVGYAQLDSYGTWAQDPGYGAVWYPALTIVDWAPYRYGHWAWIAPWGWTWIDDAPWGFAPFHYGRWTMIGARWCWVPGPMVVRPYYAPALVVFVGGPQFSIAVGTGPAVGWYPLAPGEAWWPVYRTSPRYVSFVNYNINLAAYPRQFDNHIWRQRPVAVTAVAEDDFRRGRPVERHWQPVSPQAIVGAQVGVAPARPEFRVSREASGVPRLQSPPPAVPPQRFWGGREAPPAVQEQLRAQREQERLQRDADRAAREQMRQQEQVQRQQQDQARREAERVRREAWQHQREQERQLGAPPAFQRMSQQPAAPQVRQQQPQQPPALQQRVPQREVVPSAQVAPPPQAQPREGGARGHESRRGEIRWPREGAEGPGRGHRD
jgi:hypothetical protein